MNRPIQIKHRFPFGVSDLYIKGIKVRGMIKILFVVALIAGCSKPISTTPEEYDPNLSTWKTVDW
jgi:hypothetical protein